MSSFYGSRQWVYAKTKWPYYSVVHYSLSQILLQLPPNFSMWFGEQHGLKEHILHSSVQVLILCPTSLQLLQHKSLGCRVHPRSSRYSILFRFSTSWNRASIPRWFVDLKKSFVVLSFSFSRPCCVKGWIFFGYLRITTGLNKRRFCTAARRDDLSGIYMLYNVI
jgi:hypothetical protein